MTLNFGVLLEFLPKAIAEINDPRKPGNATSSSIKDAFLGAFSVFYMQCESFLEHQRQMHSRCGKDNAQSLFGLTKTPTTPQIRNILDEIAAQGRNLARFYEIRRFRGMVAIASVDLAMR